MRSIMTSRHGISLLASLLLAAGATACSDDEARGAGGGSADGAAGGGGACDAFLPGTNMLPLDWAIGEEDPDLTAVVQASGDLARGAEVILTELAAACADAAPAFGRERPRVGDPATIEEATAACAPIPGEVRAVLEAQGVTFPIEPGASHGCAVDEAEATCRADCSGEATCDAYCASAVLYLAACPPASLTAFIGDAEVTSPSAELAAAVEVVSRLLGAHARFDLLVDAATRLPISVDGDTLADLKAACVPRVVQAVSDAGEDTAAAGEIVTDVSLASP